MDIVGILAACAIWPAAVHGSASEVQMRNLTPFEMRSCATTALWAASMITSVCGRHLIARFGALRMSQTVLLGCAVSLGCVGAFGTVWALLLDRPVEGLQSVCNRLGADAARARVAERHLDRVVLQSDGPCRALLELGEEEMRQGSIVVRRLRPVTSAGG